jgi:exodeoxyribonuclease-3
VRIATYNVNSLRARLPRVLDWLSRSDLDVVTLQETKCREDQFPGPSFKELGYEWAHHGFSQWNGVAVLSRVGLADVAFEFPGMPTWGDPAAYEARAIGATCGGIRVWSLYVPNGRTLDDPHMPYKLAWLDALSRAGKQWLADDPSAQIALTGDWNVAPEDDDVWDMAAFAGSTHVSAPERAAFASVVEAGFADVVRPHTPGAFTYWDYQQLRFPRKEGMRIDFVLASPALAARTKTAMIDREMRKGKGPSDHAPVMVELV